MKKRGRKPSVADDKAREWLRRHDEYGETASSIAERDGYDIKTVKRYLVKSKEEKDERVARQLMIRGFLEKHMTALTNMADKIQKALPTHQPEDIELLFCKEPLYVALKEHIPKSPLWGDIEEMGKMSQLFQQNINSFRERARREVEKEVGMPLVSDIQQDGISEGLIDAFVFHVEDIAIGGDGIDGHTIREDKIENSVVGYIGAYRLFRCTGSRKAEYRDIFNKLLEDMVDWKETDGLSQVFHNFIGLKSNIEAILVRVKLRGLVPGRCQYCPA